MNFFKNKHIVVAMIVAHVLAILSYLAVDSLLLEPPQTAQAGSVYPLVAMSNCRYNSGQCDLVNGGLQARLSLENKAQQVFLRLASSHPLQATTVGFILANGVEIEPKQMIAGDKLGLIWSAKLDKNIDAQSMIRIVLRANDAQYFVESEMDFVTYHTIYNKDFRREHSE